jgi:RNA polymerase sigma-70 factor (ECF subfamily)
MATSQTHQLDELKRLNARYRAPLVAFFVRRGLGQADAEDLTQDVFVRLMGNRAEAIENTDAYIFQIAANLLKDRFRREMTRSSAYSNLSALDMFGAETLDPSRQFAGREQLAEVNRYLNELPERTRNVFVLFRIEGIGQNEIAAAYQISTRSVQQLVANAMAHIMTRLQSGEYK